jgi:hypothetical protein
MSFLWGMINVLQLIIIQSMMSINISPLPRAINKIILEFTQVDIIPYEKFKDFLFPSEESYDDKDEHVNDYFD